jgi:3'-phosphoadenosine 5'-phosphosulfate sulfotransferase (PAPS reductase)/FAD synthetase
MTRHVVMFSGGVGSWAAAKRVAHEHGTDGMVLLFTDTRMEDPDLYRFIEEGAANIGAPLVTVADGRTPWQVYADERFLGNSRIDPCSKILKRQQADAWLIANCDPADTICYVGIDWTEMHRFDRLAPRKAAQGWTYRAPLCAPPYLNRRDVFDWLEREGIRRPALYDLGFSHNNCGGFCCKAGQGHFARLLDVLPERYAYHEAKEQEMREYLGRDVSMLKDTRGGESVPLTLRMLRERIQAEPDQIDLFEIGGCGCFLDEPEAA